MCTRMAWSSGDELCEVSEVSAILYIFLFTINPHVDQCVFFFLGVIIPMLTFHFFAAGHIMRMHSVICDLFLGDPTVAT
jgi:hypothetical protein